jgi:hypothetical protein
MNRALALTLLCCAACDAPSIAVVDNGFADTFTVQRAWWLTTDFDTPVPPGQSSSPLRTVPGKDVAWAVLKSPDAGVTAVRTIGLETLDGQGAELHIGIGAASVLGLCGASGPLSNEDALTAERLFPAELSGTYDQSTCTYLSTP